MLAASTMNMIIIAILMVGFAVGLRTFTGPAVIAWASYFGLIVLTSTPASFLTSPVAVVVISLLAVSEYVFDLLPQTPPRTALPGLTGRFIFGTLSAACLLVAGGQSLAFCVLGGLASIAGAFAGYQMRTRLGRRLAVKDAYIAIPEDLVAIAIAAAGIYAIS